MHATVRVVVPERVTRVLGRPSVLLVLGAVILFLDLVTGRFLQFPILFVLPVCLAAWLCEDPRWAYALAVLLPLGRVLIAYFVDQPSTLAYILTNALVRIAVLSLLAYLVARMSLQARELQTRVTELVRMCAWSRTIEYQGEWLTFEDYLKRRFNIDTTHGIAPGESQRLLEQLAKASPPR